MEPPEEQSGPTELDAVRPLADFLEDLVHRSATNVTEAQAEKMRHILSWYADVFSRDDLDLG